MSGFCSCSKFVSRSFRIGKTLTLIPTLNDVRRIKLSFYTQKIGKIDIMKHCYKTNQQRIITLKQLSGYRENKHIKFEKLIKCNGETSIQIIKLLAINGTIDLTDYDTKSMFMINQVHDRSELYVTSSQFADIKIDGNIL